MPSGARAEIVRRFRSVDSDPSSPLYRRHLGRFKGIGDTTWLSLLPATGAAPSIHGLVLEAASGTGKTTEVESQAERLRVDGISAFVCTAKRVASSGLAAALDGQLESFRSWQAGAS